MDTNLEVVVLPVHDVDRAKDFYAGLGWRLDADIAPNDRVRIVQFTPPGSPASIHFGVGLTDAAPGSGNAYLVVDDIAAARDELIKGGADVSAVVHRTAAFDYEPGPAPSGGSYSNFASFRDPDGNTWTVQEITERFAGRIDSGVTAFSSVDDLAAALRRAEAAHGEHEARTGVRDEDWPTWYATFMAAEQSGEGLPQ